MAVAALGLHAAVATPRPRAQPAPTVIGSCVSTARLSFRHGVDGAVLDEDDAAEVAAAIVKRYPMLERDGLYPEAVALWQRPGTGWVYATLMRRAHAPHARCFTATVSATAVPATPALLKKYIGRPP
ncbi:MAG: hypothetical protein KF891_06545 [Rhizobacter sp.]|nr:hypothetical protein [Rhizobacter sp.]